MHDNRWEAEKEEEKGKKEEQEKEKTMVEDKPKAPSEKVSFSCFQRFFFFLSTPVSCRRWWSLKLMTDLISCFLSSLEACCCREISC